MADDTCPHMGLCSTHNRIEVHAPDGDLIGWMDHGLWLEMQEEDRRMWSRVAIMATITHQGENVIEPPNEREAVQRDDLSFMCLQCLGDWYACECPRETSKEGPHNGPTPV